MFPNYTGGLESYNNTIVLEFADYQKARSFHVKLRDRNLSVLKSWHR
jgi:hypothetical protein